MFNLGQAIYIDWLTVEHIALRWIDIFAISVFMSAANTSRFAAVRRGMHTGQSADDTGMTGEILDGVVKSKCDAMTRLTSRKCIGSFVWEAYKDGTVPHLLPTHRRFSLSQGQVVQSM